MSYFSQKGHVSYICLQLLAFCFVENIKLLANRLPRKSCRYYWMEVILKYEIIHLNK